MKNNDILFFDFETTSNSHRTAQIVQIASVVIDGLELEVKRDSIFQTLVRPEFDEEYCERYNLAPLTDETIRIHGKTKEMLEPAPSLKVAWSQWVEYINYYNYQGSKWDKVIPAGKNIANYDIPICNRIASQEPFKFGPWDKKRHELTLFQPRDMFDIEDDIKRWFKFQKDQKSYSMDNLRPLLGIPSDGAHDALNDVMVGAFLLCKFLKIYKHFCPKVSFKNAFNRDGTNTQIKEILDAHKSGLI